VFIRSYGLFWLKEDVNWAPGSGTRGEYRLLGRVGQNRGNIRIVDFREQRGIYVLYDDWGPSYVGLARRQPIGNRLRDHTRPSDPMFDRWDRFSWFGFRSVLKQRDASGLSLLGMIPTKLLTDSDKTIGDVEALLILTLGTQGIGNAQRMRFARADGWRQIRRHELDYYLAKVAR
jgi:hypothetical protein